MCDAATDEVSDMQLEYLQPEQLGLLPSDVPKQGKWPHIRAPKWPFSGDLVCQPPPQAGDLSSALSGVACICERWVASACINAARQFLSCCPADTKIWDGS